jgi:hypothetical protein
MYAYSSPQSGHHTDYTITVSEVRNFLPHVKCTSYLPALLYPERDANNDLSKRRELLSHQNSVHILKHLNSPQYLLYIR